MTGAWLMHVGRDLRVAIGVDELLYLLPQPPVAFAVPRAPPHARCVIEWEGLLIPLIDMRQLLGSSAPADSRCAGVVGATLGATREPQYAALLLQQAPQRIEVLDEQACGLPANHERWRSIALSCFRHPLHGAVPILDVAGLLGAQP